MKIKWINKYNSKKMVGKNLKDRQKNLKAMQKKA